jgi:NAD(P)-dependent dehydrogenase (short-subunit alcohol dehydrogenase family)
MSEPVVTPFTFRSTADDVVAGLDLSGRRALITGASSGLGAETARALAAAGASVVLAVRNLDAGKSTAERITAVTGNQDVTVAHLDLADLASVRALAGSWSGPLDVLVNNAGVMALPQLQRTPEGREMHLAVNFLGHYALTTGLHRALAAAGGARVVSLSSVAHLNHPVVFDDLDHRARPYDPHGAHGESKTAVVLLMVEAARRWADDGIVANAVSPGAAPTDLYRHVGGLRIPSERMKTVPQGASTIVMMAASPVVEGVTGRYFEHGKQAPVLPPKAVMLIAGVAPFALDPEAAARLWDVAASLVPAADS